MNETYNLMENAMLDNVGIDDDTMLSIVQAGVAQFFKRAKFTESIIVPSLDSPMGVAEVKADDYLSQIEEGHFSICTPVLEPGSMVSERAQSKIADWLETETVRKSFMINNFKCHILKAELFNDTFVCFTVELLEGDVA